MKNIPEINRNRGHLLNPLVYGFRPPRMRCEPKMVESFKNDEFPRPQTDRPIRVPNYPMARIAVEIAGDD